MNFNEMTVEEIIEYFCNKFNNNEPFSLQELREAVCSCSITDPVANADAITIFYSGGEDKIAEALGKSGNENIRIINRTDRFKLLNYKDLYTKNSFDAWVKNAIQYENPGIVDNELKRIFIQEMYGVSEAGTDITEVGNGYWSQASADFAAATSGDSYALITNARDDRIFAREELKQLYNVADDAKKISGYTRSELAALGEDRLFEILKEQVINDFKNADVYVDLYGSKVGMDFKGTELEGVIKEVIPDNPNECICIKNSEYLNIANMDSDAFKNGIKESAVYLNEQGEIIGRSYNGTLLEGKLKDAVPEKYTYQTTYEAYSQFADDAAMRNKFGTDYDLLTTAEKYRLKEIDYFARIIDGIDDMAKLEKATADYLKGSGKTMESLNSIDRMLIKISTKTDWQKNASVSKINAWLESAQKSTTFAKVLKGAEAAGYAAISAMAAYTVYDTVYRANSAIDEGRYGEAAGIVAGSSADLAITLVGGEALAGNLIPYFAGAGMALAGPAGSLIGGILAGIIGFNISSGIGNAVNKLFRGIGLSWDYMFGNASSVLRYVDPLVLDADGDGFEILSVDDGVYFDEDASGLTERTAWVSGDDALLAVDLNGNGIIDDGSELFGTSTMLKNGKRAKNGFEALQQYDSNSDGVIDENDEEYFKILVWQDKDCDGISRSEELVSLKKAGIKSISLETGYESGRKVSAVTYADGTITKLGEFDFEARYYDTIEKEKIEIAAETEALPDVRAMGNVESLHTLMQKDETGVLTGYVKEFVAAQTHDEKEALVTKILYFITGADDIGANSRGGEMDARMLTVIEKFMGQNFMGTQGANPVNTAAPILENLYNEIFNSYYCLLNSQTGLAGYMNLLAVTENEDGTITINTEAFDAFIKLCRDNGADMTETVGEMGRYIRYVNASDSGNFIRYKNKYRTEIKYYECIMKYTSPYSFTGTAESDCYKGIRTENVIFGEGGNDTLYGGTGNDVIFGDEGDDRLYGDEGCDTLIGGEGNDYLSGDEGNDTYIFNPGDGNDVISDYENSASSGKADRILFGEGITPEDVRMERVGNNLVIRYSETDSITVRNAYSYGDGRYFVENIVFADGTSLNKTEIGQRAHNLYGTEGDDNMSGYGFSVGYDVSEVIHGLEGNDTISGKEGNDTIYGDEGDDRLYGDEGCDTLIGGEGNDYLSGGEGNDIYIFNPGDGNDVISDYENSASSGKADRILFGEGITPEDVRMERVGNNLVIRYSETDSITVQSAYSYGDGRCRVENMVFDGIAKYSINYNKISLELIEAYMKVNEPVTDACTESVTETSDDTGAFDISDASVVCVDAMLNLLVQEMSEMSSDNVTDINYNGTDINTNNTVQLWVEK